MRVLLFIGLAKLGLGTREMAFDRSPTDVEDTGDFVIGEFLQIPQHQEFSVVDPEPTERVPHPASAALLAEEVLRWAGGIAVHPGANGVLMVPDQRLPALPVASNFHTLLERDPIEPRLDRGVPPEAGHAFKGRQEDLLGHLLGHCLIEQMAATITEYDILIAWDQYTHSQGELPLVYVVSDGYLTPTQRLVRGPGSVHVPLRTS